MDNRAQSIGLARFILSLIAGVPVCWIVWKVTDPILAGAKESTNSTQANNATQWFQQGTDFMPVAFLFIAFFGIVVFAVYQREVAG